MRHHKFYTRLFNLFEILQKFDTCMLTSMSSCFASKITGKQKDSRRYVSEFGVKWPICLMCLRIVGQMKIVDNGVIKIFYETLESSVDSMSLEDLSQIIVSQLLNSFRAMHLMHRWEVTLLILVTKILQLRLIK